MKSKTVPQPVLVAATAILLMFAVGEVCLVCYLNYRHGLQVVLPTVLLFLPMLLLLLPAKSNQMRARVVITLLVVAFIDTALLVAFGYMRSIAMLLIVYPVVLSVRTVLWQPNVAGANDRT